MGAWALTQCDDPGIPQVMIVSQVATRSWNCLGVLAWQSAQAPGALCSLCVPVEPAATTATYGPALGFLLSLFRLSPLFPFLLLHRYVIRPFEYLALMYIPHFSMGSTHCFAQFPCYHHAFNVPHSKLAPDPHITMPHRIPKAFCGHVTASGISGCVQCHRLRQAFNGVLPKLGIDRILRER